MARRANEFQTIRSEGGLLPPDLLRRVIDPKAKLPGTKPEDYGLAAGDRLNETITQSWNQLRRHWREFQAAAANLAKDEAGTGLTNDRWNLPLLRELGFGLLPTSPGPELNGRTYAINRFFGPVPVHLLGCGLSLDRRTAGQRGAAAINPHGLVQEFLNRSTDHLWAVVANGLRFRILRDNQALSRQSFLEFDLEAMFNGEVFSDFVLFWLMAHASRFAPRDESRTDSCRLEEWTREAAELGTRALGDLSAGVEQALQVLGQGFTSHPKNIDLREALRDGILTPAQLHGQLLRVVYRFIFLFVAEDRTLEGLSLLHPRDNTDLARLARERYAAHYSTTRLRDMASQIKGSRHGDLWRQFQVLVGALSGAADFAAARTQLALPALGSYLWDPNATADLNQTELTNYDLLETLRHLAFTRQGRVLRPVDYKHLGAEELGGVYEGLLTLTPQVSGDGSRFAFAEFAGNERKTSGSYYTPDSLVQCLLDSALDPVVEAAIKGKNSSEAEQALLSLKVCDPSVGSGHFLVGAAHRLARHLARVRALAQGESEPSPLLYQHALRDVIGRCLYGVDINPMAAELCRVNLWLEALEPGMPLSFLDHHIQVGNSLLGATPQLIAGSLPDEAFKAIGDDDKKACAALKKRNKAERKGRGTLFANQDAETQVCLAKTANALVELPDDRPEAVRAKEQAFRSYQETPEYQTGKQLADAWCAAFVIRKYFPPHASDPRFLSEEPYGITQGMLSRLASGHPFTTEMAAEVGRLVSQYQFFHWHLAFPEVFSRGGFDCMLGNPPWERVKLQELEFFASESEMIAKTKNAAARKKLIASLPISDPELWMKWITASRMAQGQSHYARNSGKFPLCGQGDINVYALFAEQNRQLIVPMGRTGFIVPSGIATDNTTKDYFQSITKTGQLRSLWEFENEGFFAAGKGHMVRFALTTLAGSGEPTAGADFLFQGQAVTDLHDPDRHFTLSAKDIEAINPNTGTCPIFRTKRDALISLAIYRAAGVLWRENDPDGNPWGMKFLRMFDMTNDSGLFRQYGELISAGWALEGNHFVKDDNMVLPLFEAKMVNMYNHRSGSFDGVVKGERPHRLPSPSDEQLVDPNYTILPFYWVDESEVVKKLQNLWDRSWFIGWRDVTDARASVRTMVPYLFPRSAVGNTIFLIFPSSNMALVACLYASLASFALDYAARQKIGGLHLTYSYMKQLPVLKPNEYLNLVVWDEGVTVRDWLLPRIMELTYTAWDLQPFAEDCGDDGPPFIWDPERRFQLQCEIDASFFHLYGLTHEEADYILDTFPVVRRNDVRIHGEFRTKRVILEIYDSLASAAALGESYKSPLSPPRRAT